MKQGSSAKQLVAPPPATPHFGTTLALSILTCLEASNAIPQSGLEQKRLGLRPELAWRWPGFRGRHLRNRVQGPEPGQRHSTVAFPARGSFPQPLARFFPV